MAGSMAYLLPYQKAEPDAREYLTSTDELTLYDGRLERTEYYSLENRKSDTALIFYPGAKVDPVAYSQLCRKIADSGIDVYLIRMPFHMALFNMNGAEDIIDHKAYSHVYLAGHSLGGTMAANYTANHSQNVDGLILLASYSTRQIKEVPVLSIYGDKDGCLEMNVYNKNKVNFPKDTTEVIIPGGNHAQFGQYGHQKGDNEAAISCEEQIDETVSAILSFIKNH